MFPGVHTADLFNEGIRCDFLFIRILAETSNGGGRLINLPRNCTGGGRRIIGALEITHDGSR